MLIHAAMTVLVAPLRALVLSQLPDLQIRGPKGQPRLGGETPLKKGDLTEIDSFERIH